ncbi:MAG: histidine phosphatase family protein [Aeromicrobium sp.]|uniref:histidine phosphatase family protein n=1 Tax=Aeromicrobium sp. TaxID=1871063 RepID=UPI0026353D44|nr:histidine phosphatase family protein [Aeromicrobium sp.]MDF1705656.1 histidine phosphatase family protein [Aeromicrobium sp.]
MIVWLRHGQSTWNAAGRFQGHTPHPPLTALGLEQAYAAAAEAAPLGIEHVVSSPAVRARQTAVVVARALGLPVHLDPRLVEQGYGEPLDLVGARTAAALADVPNGTALVVSHGDVIALAVSRATGEPAHLPDNGELQIVP